MWVTEEIKSFVEKIRDTAHAFHTTIAFASCVTLMLLCFLPNFATVGGHNRAFTNLWCGENTIESQADINLWDCTMETRMVKVFLPLATVFQLFVLSQAYSIYTWHKTFEEGDKITGSDRFFLHTPTIYVAFSLLWSLIFGCIYIINHEKMTYIVGNTITPLASYKDGTFLALWATTIALQILQGMGWGVFASISNYAGKVYGAIPNVTTVVNQAFNPKSSGIIQSSNKV